MTLIGKEAGKFFTIHMKTYKVMSEPDLRAFQQLVRDGGEVTSAGLSRRMESAHMLGYAEMDDRLVAVGAVKRPYDSYVKKLSRLTGYHLIDCVAELGWIYVAPEARGKQLGLRLSSDLCGSYEKSMFATTRSDNEPMQVILGKLGFKSVGAEYDSVEHPGATLGLWLRGR